jgi:hypothetical protein
MDTAPQYRIVKKLSYSRSDNNIRKGTGHQPALQPSLPPSLRFGGRRKLRLSKKASVGKAWLFYFLAGPEYP